MRALRLLARMSEVSQVAFEAAGFLMDPDTSDLPSRQVRKIEAARKNNLQIVQKYVRHRPGKKGRVESDYLVVMRGYTDLDKFLQDGQSRQNRATGKPKKSEPFYITIDKKGNVTRSSELPEPPQNFQVAAGGKTFSVDYNLKQRVPGTVSTEFNRNLRSSDGLYHRSRKIEGSDFTIHMYFPYGRDGAGTEVMDAIKAVDTAEKLHFVKRTAIFMASKLKKLGIDAVMPAPSADPLARMYAAELSVRLNAPLLKAPLKFQSMSSIPKNDRMRLAPDNFEVPDRMPWLKGHILIVDDFSTTQATFVGIAANLYMNPKVTKVTGVGLTPGDKSKTDKVSDVKN